MILKRHPRRGALLAGFLILVSPVLERAQASDRDQDEVSAFLRSMAATIYQAAWPTASYKRTEFDGSQREADGIAVVMKLSGEGLFENNLWVKLGIVVNRDGIKDL